jgi:hypothetical protein
LFHLVFREHKCHVFDLRAIAPLADTIENVLLHFTIETTSGFREEYTPKGICARSKCRKRPTHVERSVETPDTLRRDRIFTIHSSFVFNQMPRSPQVPTVGNRSAPFSETEGNPLLDGLRKGLDERGRISEIPDE